MNDDSSIDRRVEKNILRLTDLPMPPGSRLLVMNDDSSIDRRAERNIFLRLTDLPMRL